MAPPSEVTVFKGSKGGSVVKEVLEGRTELKSNEVAIKITHSGVS
jgi:hypothetical protein